MNNYIITEDSLYYKKSIHKKFKNFEDCKKWIKNNLDNTKNWKVFNGLYSTIIINNYIMNDYRDSFNEDYINKGYIKQLMEDYKNEIL